MAQNLITDLTITLAAGATTTSNHLLVDADGTGLIPFEVRPDRVTSIVASNATTSQVTFTNEGSGSETAIFRCWRYVSNVAPEATTALLWGGGVGGSQSSRYNDDVAAWFGTDDDAKIVFDTQAKPFLGIIGITPSTPTFGADFFFQAANGGVAAGGDAAGDGAYVFIVAGAGGDGATGVGSTAGAGGTADLYGGDGGAGFAGVGDGGDGGATSQVGGVGGAGAAGQTGGTGGSATLAGGDGGIASGGTQGTGGAVEIYGGDGLVQGDVNLGHFTTRQTKVWTPFTQAIGASTAAAGANSGNAAVLPAATASVYPTTAADGTTGVRVNAADQVTGRTIDIGNGVSTQILKVYAPTGGTINGAGADVAFSSVSGKGVRMVCLNSAANTWLAW